MIAPRFFPDWIYQAVGQVAPGAVVDLNRAVAVAMEWGPADALRIVDELVASDEPADSHLLPRVRAKLLARLDSHDEAAAETCWQARRLRPALRPDGPRSQQAPGTPLRAATDAALPVSKISMTTSLSR